MKLAAKLRLLASGLTNEQRKTCTEEILDEMRKTYEVEGEVGDFADAKRYLINDASDEELRYEYKKWCKKII